MSGGGREVFSFTCSENFKWGRSRRSGTYHPGNWMAQQGDGLTDGLTDRAKLRKTGDDGRPHDARSAPQLRT